MRVDLPRYYFKNADGFYVYPIYNNLLFLFIVCFGVSRFSRFLINKFHLNFLYFEATFGFLAFILGFLILINLIVGIKNNSGILKYFNSISIENMVRKNILNSLDFNRYKTSPFIEVPSVYACYKNKGQIELIIGKIPTMNSVDIERLKSDINSSLRGVYKNLAVTDGNIEKDGTNFIFCIEDVNISHRFVVRNGVIDKFVSDDPYKIRLSDNLTWNTILSPMLSVVGRTRSGKSMFSSYLLSIMEKQGWEIHYYSVKDDYFVKQFTGKSDYKKIVEDLEDFVQEMKSRNALIKNENAKDFRALGLNKIAIFLDELGLLNGTLENDKEYKKRYVIAITALMGAGASAGFTVVAMSQRGTKDFFLPPSAAVNAKDSVIFLGQEADSAQDRMYLLPGFDLEHRNYTAGQGIAYFVSSEQRWQTPSFYETPLILKDNRGN